ncbi:hypothetical protein ACTFIZ_007744 [Dictyostelium cf. discoideum]
MFNFVFSYFKNDPIIENNEDENDSYESDYEDDEIINDNNNLQQQQQQQQQIKIFPNYLIISILNMILNFEYKDGIKIKHFPTKKLNIFQNILKMTLVSKNFETNIIPHLNYPIFILKNSKDIFYVQKLVKNGITANCKNPFVNINQLNINLPNEYKLTETSPTNSIFKQLLLFKDNFKLEKLKISTALVPNDMDCEVPSILVEFIIKYQIKELELHNLPAIKNPTFSETKPILNYSFLSNRIDLCNIQHLCLKNQLLSCDRVMDFLELIPRLLSLDLTNNRIGLDYRECFTNAIRNANQLSSLKLSSNILKDNVLQLLPILKSNCYQLNTLDLSENHITDESSKSIEEFIQFNKTIESLNLSGNSFTELGVNIIFSSLIQNETLTDLTLSNFQNFNTTLFSEYLSGKNSYKLKSLNLSNSKILCSSNLIFQSLSSNNNNNNNNNNNFKSSLKYLDLSYCLINDDSQINLLSQYFNSNENCKLEKLKLLKTFKESVPCKLLFSNLSQSITDLDLSLNYLNNENSIELSTILETNKSIRSLNLTCTIIRNLGSLFNSLKFNDTLLYLNLSRNSIKFKDIIDFQFLIVNKSLISLNLSNNAIETNEMLQFFKHLSKNRSIKYLDISNNPINGDIQFPSFKRRNQILSLDIKVSNFLKNNPALTKITNNIKVVQNKPYSITKYDSYTSDYFAFQQKKPMKRAAY